MYVVRFELAGLAGRLAVPGVGFDQRPDSALRESFDLLGVPEAGVRERRLDTVGNACQLELVVCFLDERLDVLRSFPPPITSAVITI